MNYIDVYEHGRLIIDDNVFTHAHWKAFVKLNTVHDGAYFDVLHNGLKFKQFVGVIQVDGLLVHIHPKADKNDNEVRWKGVLLQMLKECGHLNAQALGNAQLRKQQLNLLEVYFDFFLREVETLIHTGLVKKYRKEVGNVKALKGKLEFAGNIRNNLVHQERFYTSHQVYDTNHKLHQILRYALEIVGQFTRGTALNDHCKRIELAFPKVDVMRITEQTFQTIQLNRKTAPYERALELAKFIILNYSPDIHHGQQKMIALLFDMNLLWEQYVLKKLKKYVLEHVDKGWRITGQESKLFFGTNRSIRPDIILRRRIGERDEVVVIDTKWKNPVNQLVSIEDLRQMYTYGRFWNAQKLILLYPGNDKTGNFKPFPNNHDGDEKHTCKQVFVSVFDAENNLDLQLGEKIVRSVGSD